MGLRLFYFILFIAISTSISGQIVINEVLSSNVNGIVDEDQAYDDWIELYNSSNDTINLKDYILDDHFSDTTGWVFPEITIDPQSFLLVFASGKDRKDISLKSKTIINEGDSWKYIVPPNSLANGDWRKSDFNDSDWLSGQSGFGYGDNDDNTIIQPLESIYIRKEFTIDRLSEIKNITLHVDFDDAFIAFINGVPVASENVDVSESDYDNIEVIGGHEAVLSDGGIPTGYEIDINAVNLVEGINVIALQGYNISEGSTDFTLIPFLTIESNAYNIDDVADFINLDGRGNLHSDFKISKDGESLYLYNAQHELIDSIYVVPLIADVSYGRYADGSDNWFYFPVPTPGEANLNPIEELRNDTVYFSIPAGFYSQANQLNLSSSADDVVIKYTNDGTEPTIISQQYSSSITLNETQAIKAAAFSNDVKVGETFTNTYFIGTKHELPVISLSTDPKNLFDWNEGILVLGPNAEASDPHYGANYWMDWEKVVHFEYFDEDGITQIAQDAGVKITGAWSRAHAQKSMALYARSKYGKGSFSYKFFKDKPTTNYESIILRNSGNDWPQTMLRDGYLSEVVKDLNVDRLAYQPTVVYLNGAYWGILNMREKPNEHYFENNYGVKPEELNLLEANKVVVVGSANDYSGVISFITNRSVLNDTDYNSVIDKINVDCFIDYELIQIFINNRDWPGNNIKYWNTVNPDSKFRWLLYDTDFGLGLYGNQEYKEDGISYATESSSWSTLLLRRMLSNEVFKQQFITRMADLINTNFTIENMDSKLDSVSSLIDSEIEAHQNLWGRQYSGWVDRVQAISKFNSLRSSFVEQHFIDYFGLTRTCTVTLSVSDEMHGQIKVNKIVPSEYPFSGSYFSNVPITFKALPKPGYKFVRWENDSNSSKADITLTLTGTTRLHAVFQEDNSDDFDVVINEINYQSAGGFDSGDWIEIYNLSDKTIDLLGWKISDDENDKMYIFPEGNILYPNDYFVICKNLEKFKIVHSDVENVNGDFEFGLSSSGDFINLMDIDNNIIDQVMYETKLPWPIEPLTTSSTLELVNPYGDNNVYNSWAAGLEGGTPGRRNGTLTSIEELTKLTHHISCFPTHFSDYTSLRFYSPGEGDYSIQIVDIQGRIIKTIEGEFLNEGTHYLDIFTASEFYQKGMYFVKVKTELGTETIRVIKH